MEPKACGRADRGCVGFVRAFTLQRRPKTTYCSHSCAVRARVEAGWRPHGGLTKAGRQLGGRRGGHISGIRKKRDALLRAVQPMEKYLTPEFKDGLSPDQLARVRVLIARAYQVGHRRGYQTGHAKKRYQAQKAKAA